MIKTKVIFPKETMKKKMIRFAVAEQTKRLCRYAESELYEMIVSHTFHSRTFNLADSYVWAVYYNKKEQGHGYVGVKMASKDAKFHGRDIDGRKEAKEFLSKFKSQSLENGWTIVWAACAPYSVYLDPAAGSHKSSHFFVVSQRYDHIKGTLEPKCKVEFRTAV